MSHNVLAVANEILDIADQKKIDLTAMQLIKLAYLAHGWSYAFLNESIVQDTPEAWQYGPVYPSLYREVGRAGAAPIRKRIKNELGVPYKADFLREERRLLEKIVIDYGKKHAFALSSITHKSDTPWDKTFKKYGAYSPIPESEMSRHFSDLKKDRSLGEIKSG